MKLIEDIAYVASGIWKLRRFWVLFAILSGLAVVYTASTTSPGGIKPDGTAWPNVALSLCIAIFSAALIEIFSQINGLTELRGKQRKLREFIGFRDSGKSVAIVLSRFDGDPGPIWQKQVKTPVWKKQVEEWRKSERLQSEDSAVQGSVGIAVESDIVAASDLLKLFSSLGFHAPALIWDDLAVLEYENERSPFKTFITLGIASNALAMHINDLGNVSRKFKLDIDSNWTGTPTERATLWELKVALYKGQSIDWTEGNWRPFRFKKESEDYGLISRVEDGEKTVFLLAGINADGTQRLSNFVTQNWTSILEWKDDTSKYQVKNHCFAAVVDFPVDSRPVGGGRYVVVSGSNR